MSSSAAPPYRSGWQHRARGNRWLPISAIVALHLGGLYAALQFGPVRERLKEAAPLFVSFIQASPAPQVQAPPPKPEPDKPKPLQRMIATPRPTASPMQAPPEPVKQEQEPVQDAAPTEPPAPPAPPAPAAAAPVIPPNFAAAYLDNPTPLYPNASRELKESGRVLLRVDVSPTGHSRHIELQQSSGYQRLDQVAIEAVWQWRFVPAKQGDQAVAAWVIVPINFQLDP